MDENTLKDITQLDPSLTSVSTSERTQSNAEVEKNEFINLLVTQLQNQDPLNPMQNEEFAVQLAQFTQVEQLVAINEKLGSEESGADFSSMASYLGHEVLLNTDIVNVENGEGGQISFDLAQDAAAVAVQLIDSSGLVREQIDLGEMEAGKHSAKLEGLTSNTGEFNAVIQAISQQGSPFEPEVSVSGVVSGYVPGPNPSLLVGNKEISTGDIREVRVPVSS